MTRRLSLGIALGIAVFLFASAATASPPPHYVYTTTISQDTTPDCITIDPTEYSSSVLFSIWNECADPFEIEAVECTDDDCAPSPLTVAAGDMSSLTAANHMGWLENAGSGDDAGSLSATYGWSVGSEEGVVQADFEREFRDSSPCGCASGPDGAPSPGSLVLVALTGLALSHRRWRRLI